MAQTAINQTDLTGMFKYANEVSEGAFGASLIISTFIVIFAYLSIKGEETFESFVVAGFITTILTILLRLMEIVSNTHLFTVIVVFILGVLVTYFKND